MATTAKTFTRTAAAAEGNSEKSINELLVNYQNKGSSEMPVKFQYLEIVSFVGVFKNYNLPPCFSQASKKQGMSHASKVKFSIIGAVLFLISLSCFFATLYWVSKMRRKPVAVPSAEDSFVNVSYAELFKATDGFSSANSVGTGSFGTVFKGILDRLGTMVAIKVFNLQRQGAMRSFIAECEALRNIRHRNLVKIITCCSSIDFEGNDFKALVYEYMPNGSLEK
ncbi:probable LRR receptor-like serine/threonine-protein kinase At3g47570 [Magnolia sinica]|uniref:probable LRR receptor-like serine/threonine-protein kinase At3g47570 n=1 Tax=Magnolia sinica TaxID=86752 RepID=UPI002659E2AD|nr:probable LRR receptor-like serine/threonine-protein kinase At3g47570 [Magnolia sinica]